MADLSQRAARDAEMLADGYVSCPWCGRQGTVRTNESPYGDDPERRCPLCEGTTYVLDGVAEVVNELLATIAHLRSELRRCDELDY